MPEVPPAAKTRITEMSANEQESIIAKVKGRLKEKRFGYLLKKKKPDLVCQEWDSNPRLHSETRTLATIYTVKEFHLESGALDRSAILTAHKLF